MQNVFTVHIEHEHDADRVREAIRHAVAGIVEDIDLDSITVVEGDTVVSAYEFER